jgi:hypothetical protein
MTRDKRAFIRRLTESSFRYRDTVLTATPALAATMRIVGLLSEEPGVDDRFARGDVRRASEGLSSARGKAAGFA